MLDRFLNYFRDPEDTDPAFARVVRNLLIFTIVATMLSMLVVVITANTARMAVTVTALVTLLGIEVAALVMATRGNILAAKLIVPAALTVAIVIIAFNANSIHDISIIGFPLIVIIGNLLQGRRSIFVTTPLIIGAILFLGIADMTGLSNSPFAERTGIDDILIGSILLMAGSGILNQLTDRLRSALHRAETNERAQTESNRELKALQGSLEQRIAERTVELEDANQRNEKRARQFEAIAQVARATTTNESLDSLLPRLTAVISEQFGFYHTGIFLLDEQRENAVLRAANSEGGKRMLARGHKLPVGQTGIVGYVSATGNARIALDVGADAAFFNNPDLPNTRSEMALPLRAGDQIIGALDVQSIQPNAFQEQDIEVLSTLSDQVAIAIQNARSFETTQELLRDAQRISGSYLKESWQVLQADELNIGYRVSDRETVPLRKSSTSSQAKQALQEQQTIAQNGETATLAIPIRLRNEVIGVMDIRMPEEYEWDEDDIDIAEAVAERLSLSLESSLLLKSTQRRAEIERITADITGRIGATTQFDLILRTAAEELSRALGGSDVVVQIQPEILEDTPNASETPLSGAYTTYPLPRMESK